MRQAPVTAGTGFREYWQAIAPRLEAGFAEWVPQFYRDFPPDARASIMETVRDGKRLRASLVCLTSEALGGTLEAALPRAVAVECVQAASLIHDDFIDGDRIRRNRPATWTATGARRAVLLGDLMFAGAIRRMVELGAKEGGVLAGAIATIAAGAYQEPDPGARADAYPERYERLIHLKTGALFGAAARLGALSAGARPSLARRAFAFGARLGAAYQVADDLVELAPNGGAGSPARIAPALLHFAGSERENVGRALLEGGEGWRAVLPSIEARMRREIAARLETAARTLACFPDSAHRRLLQAAPQEVVGMMLAGDR